MSLVSMEDYLRGCVTVEAQAPDRLRARVRFPDDLQGPPKIAHGGGVVAMLFETVRLVAGERGGAAVLPRPVRLEVVLHREVPLRVPLHGEVAMEAGVWRSRILRDGVVLAEAEVLPGAAPLVRPSAETRRAWETAQEEAFDVPAYEFCLGCGLRNPRGAQVRFEYNPGLMWKRLTPQAHFRCADGSLFPGFLLIVGDELGWWLGALRQGECGLSNRLVVSLGAPVAHGVPLLALGDRTAVVTSDPKGRIWQTRVEIVTLDWQPVAAAEVQFVGSRAFTRLMLPRFLWGEDLAAVTRAFPRYRDQVTGSSGLARP